jgi:3-oxoacyl-(acyl-carrier-protein) synthase
MSPEAIGVIGAMTGALQVAGLAPSDIDHVNTHGTGTQNNDHTELFGLEQVMGTVPPFISTKSYTGHTLAAAGAVEAVFSILSIVHGEVWPSLHFTSPMEGFHHSPNTRMLEGLDMRHVMSNSFGFGGNCSSVIYSKF